MAIDNQVFESVCKHARRAALLQSTADTLEWDERTGMPIRGGEYRAQQVSTLRAMTHTLRTDSKYGDNLGALVAQLSGLDPHGDVAATVTNLYRDFQRDRKLPTDLVESISGATVRGQQCWDAARKADDFSMFRGQLQSIIQLKIEAGNHLAEGTDLSAYEALMDEYEPDARVAEIQDVFDAVRKPLVELISAIGDSKSPPDVSPLQRDFSIGKQREFGRRVSESVGFCFDSGRLDETSHPFCTTLGPNDIRILTRYEQNWLPSGLYGTLHEAGHGMYEQGLRNDWFGLPPGSFVSLGVHESQSRLWENQVGRSREFWQWLLPDAKATFSPTLDDASVDSIYAAANAIRPSLIRVEADEATYNLHIIIRFDLERQLIDRSLSVDDLPEAWNARYESDLGVRPPSDANGVLQDVHWSAGLIGYFPTYTLGNVISAQLFQAAQQQIGDLGDQFSRGEFEPLLHWLNENVHQYGRCYSATDLVARATGEKLTATYLADYLKKKISAVYGL